VGGFLIIIIVGFLLMWLFVVLPQRRRVSAHQHLVESLKPGDEVVTAGGLYGDVTEIGDDEVALEIAPDVEVRVAMRAIAAVIPPDAYEEDEAEGEEDAQRPVGESGPGEGDWGNREVPPAHHDAPVRDSGPGEGNGGNREVPPAHDEVPHDHVPSMAAEPEPARVESTDTDRR
jgi:preprotein translocase subunit YajC